MPLHLTDTTRGQAMSCPALTVLFDRAGRFHGCLLPTDVGWMAFCATPEAKMAVNGKPVAVGVLAPLRVFDEFRWAGGRFTIERCTSDPDELPVGRGLPAENQCEATLRHRMVRVDGGAITDWALIGSDPDCLIQSFHRATKKNLLARYSALLLHHSGRWFLYCLDADEIGVPGSSEKYRCAALANRELIWLGSCELQIQFREIDLIRGNAGGSAERQTPVASSSSETNPRSASHRGAHAIPTPSLDATIPTPVNSVVAVVARGMAGSAGTSPNAETRTPRPAVAEAAAPVAPVPIPAAAPASPSVAPPVEYHASNSPTHSVLSATAFGEKPSRVQEQSLFLARRLAEIQDNAHPPRKLLPVALPPLEMPPGRFPGTMADVADFSKHLLQAPWDSLLVFQFAEFLFGTGLIDPAREFLDRLARHLPDDRAVQESLAIVNLAESLEEGRSLDRQLDAVERARIHLTRLVLNNPRLIELRDRIMSHKTFLLLKRRSQP